MTRVSLILAVVVLLFSASSCDFLRKVAGRPTSEDIARKKAMIEAIELEKAQRAESLEDTLSAIVVESVQDTVEDVMASIVANKIKLAGSKAVSSGVRELIKFRYVVVIGAFGSPTNAEALAGRARELSYDVILIPYSNGLTAVGVCPSDDLSKCFEALMHLRKESFCPSDAWILDNNI